MIFVTSIEYLQSGLHFCEIWKQIKYLPIFEWFTLSHLKNKLNEIISFNKLP